MIIGKTYSLVQCTKKNIWSHHAPYTDTRIYATSKCIIPKIYLAALNKQDQLAQPPNAFNLFAASS